MCFVCFVEPCFVVPCFVVRFLYTCFWFLHGSDVPLFMWCDCFNCNQFCRKWKMVWRKLILSAWHRVRRLLMLWYNLYMLSCDNVYLEYYIRQKKWNVWWKCWPCVLWVQSVCIWWRIWLCHQHMMKCKNNLIIKVIDNKHIWSFYTNYGIYIQSSD